MSIDAFFIDRTPVTNAQFKTFRRCDRLSPADDRNFLARLEATALSGRLGDRPVTWVSIEDARAYAPWAGKRLPHEWEWQYAAQGDDGRALSWGNAWRDDAVRSPNKGAR